MLSFLLMHWPCSSNYSLPGAGDSWAPSALPLAEADASVVSITGFALNTYALRLAGGNRTYSVLGLAIPGHLLPFGSLVLTQVLIPRASFVGHLAGILVGYAIGFGAFDWVTPWWSASLAVWTTIGAFPWVI